MKHVLYSIALFAFLLISFRGNAQDRIVSTTPIKTEHMGLKLCDVSEDARIVQAVMHYTNKELGTDLFVDSGNLGAITCVRLVTNGNIMYYGGGNWNNIDVYLNKDNKIAQIQFSAVYKNVNQAKKAFEDFCTSLSNKYGKGNAPVVDNRFWTDNINTVGVNYEETAAVSGDDAVFFHLYYVNRALWSEIEAAMSDL